MKSNSLKTLDIELSVNTNITGDLEDALWNKLFEMIIIQGNSNENDV